VTDFWGAYNKVVCARRQMCLVHLLRDFLTVEKYKSPGPHWAAFAKPMRRLIHDAMRLSKRNDLSADEYASRRLRVDERLQTMIDSSWAIPRRNVWSSDCGVISNICSRSSINPMFLSTTTTASGAFARR